MAGARLEIVHDSFTPVFRRAAEQLGPKGLELLLRDIGEHLRFIPACAGNAAQ